MSQDILKCRESFDRIGDKNDHINVYQPFSWFLVFQKPPKFYQIMLSRQKM